MSTLWTACEIALHDLIAETLLPDQHFELGKGDSYSFRDADIIFKRVGNRTGVSRGAFSFIYTIKGFGFKGTISTVVLDGDFDVKLREVHPHNDDGLISFNQWLNPPLPARVPAACAQMTSC